MSETPASDQSELDGLKYTLKVREAADRVLERALSMHHTSELQEVINEAGKQLRSLQLDISGGVFISINEEVGPDLYCWGYGGTADYLQRVRVPYFDRPIFNGLVNHIKNGSGLYLETFSHAEKIEFFRFLFTHPPYNQTSPAHRAEVLSREGGYTRSCYTSEYTTIFFINHHGRKFSETDHEVLVRFAEVFEQGYRRFLDLQKAEQQALEAKIEASLERIRARSMAMQSSEELQDVLSLLFQQYDVLGIHPVNVFLTLFDLDHGRFIYRASGKSGKRAIGKQVVDLSATDIWDEVVEKFKNEKSASTEMIHYPKESMPAIFEIFHEAFTAVPEEFQIRQDDFPDGIYTTHGHFEHGYLGINHTRPVSKEENEIIARFSNEFGRVYRRFLDLQKAEAQAKEARIEAALEKVRSRTMGMQESDELKEVIQLVFEQFVRLDIFVEHTGFIMDYKNREDMLIWLADPKGVPTLVSIPYFSSPHWDSFIEAREAGSNFFSNLLSFEEKNKFYQELFTHISGIPEKAKQHYLDCPGLAISTVLMENVGLYIENFSGIPYTDEENDILLRFGNVFQQTYTRFLDLQQAEDQARLIRKEKERLEKALSELRATQAQLIHAEKMASLGELTAGIAHEIKNPLNFVNNFSEVSEELLEEMAEEIRNGNTKEVFEILEDLKGNLNRIVEQGKRADSIVNGMLMHSRGNQAEKEWTDINALCDEYMRLTYHGLRAKDKSFTAEMKTDYDTSLPRVLIAPQEIGRVLLNLISNAFYAVDEKRTLNTGGDYNPTVSVKTTRTENNVAIAISDNGTGMPETLTKKIFQPFFTTKPTGSGTGLGLSISYDIVKAHGGELKVLSQPEKGSTFTISLPVNPES